jgi:hypothetical protein
LKFIVSGQYKECECRAFPIAAINPEHYFPDAPTDFNSIVCEQEAVYAPRRAEESILYGVVTENLETFLARQEQRKRTVPGFVE